VSRPLSVPAAGESLTSTTGRLPHPPEHIVAIDEERVMTLIEVKAERKGRMLHNSAAPLPA
jgi:hypothetical protein